MISEGYLRLRFGGLFLRGAVGVLQYFLLKKCLLVTFSSSRIWADNLTAGNQSERNCSYRGAVYEITANIDDGIANHIDAFAIGQTEFLRGLKLTFCYL